VPFFIQLSVYWAAQSFIWGGLITIAMQTIVLRIAGDAGKDLALTVTLSSGALVSTVTAMVAGAVSDHSRNPGGRRMHFILWGSVLAAPSLCWLGAANSIPALLAAFGMLQVWTNVAISPYQALVPDLVPKERQGTASAFMGMGSLLGQMLGIVLCGLLIGGRNGQWQIMVTLSAVLVAAAVFTKLRIPEKPVTSLPPSNETIRTVLRNSLKYNPRELPDFSWLIASRFAINMGFYTATDFLNYYVKDTLKAPDPALTSMHILLLVSLCAVVGNLPAGMLADRRSKKSVVYASLAATAVGTALFLATTRIPTAMAAGVVFGVGFGAFMAVDWAMATSLLPNRNEAKYMGVWHAAFTLPQILAPMAAGPIAHTVNRQLGQGAGYRAALCMVLLYLAAGAALIHPIRERRHSEGSAA
jgi:MFS family permease